MDKRIIVIRGNLDENIELIKFAETLEKVWHRNCRKWIHDKRLAILISKE